MRKFLLMCALLVTAGCVFHARGPRGSVTVVGAPGVSAVVIKKKPRLAPIRGTRVVWCSRGDYDVYYVDGYYYQYRRGVWYRSRRYDRGWVRITILPRAFRTIPRTHPRYTVIMRVTPR